MSVIHEAIINVMREVGAIGKDKKNSQQNFNFRGVDDAMNATHELFAKHGIFVVPQVIDRTREERTTKSGGVMYSTLCRVKYTFFATDGSFVEAIIDGEGMDTADKSTSKAQSIAFKYALFQVLDIPTDIMPDPDAETPPPTKPKPQPISKTQIAELTALCMTADKKPDADKIGKLKIIYNKCGYHEAKDILTTDFNKIKSEFLEVLK